MRNYTWNTFLAPKILYHLECAQAESKAMRNISMWEKEFIKSLVDIASYTPDKTLYSNRR